jgi:hypothetical protein
MPESRDVVGSGMDVSSLEEAGRWPRASRKRGGRRAHGRAAGWPEGGRSRSCGPLVLSPHTSRVHRLTTELASLQSGAAPTLASPAPLPLTVLSSSRPWRGGCGARRGRATAALQTCHQPDGEPNERCPAKGPGMMPSAVSASVGELLRQDARIVTRPSAPPICPG